jgi:hypothetical protein
MFIRVVLWISTEEQSSNVLKIGVEIVAQGFIEALYHMFMTKLSKDSLKPLKP